MKTRRSTTLATLATSLVLIGLIASPVNAVAAPPQTPLDQCVEAATDRQIESWVCIGGWLEYSDTSSTSDEPETIVEQIAPSGVQTESTANSTIGVLA